MRSREELQALLEGALGSDRVYHQAPPNTGMKYPCIVYKFVKPDVKRADNKPYMVTGHWEAHHMYKKSNESILTKMLFLTPYVAHDNQIVADGVYNDYYTIYF